MPIGYTARPRLPTDGQRMYTPPAFREDDPAAVHADDAADSIRSAITTYEEKLLAAPAQAQAIYNQAAADLRERYDAAATDDERSIISAAWQHFDTLHAHTVQIHGDAAALVHASRDAVDLADKVTMEYDSFLRQVRDANLSRPEIAALWHQAYHEGADEGYQNAALDMQEGGDGYDVQVECAGCAVQSALTVEVSHSAAQAFAKLILSSEWLTESEQDLHRELARFIESWTRRAVNQIFMEEADGDAEMTDPEWWEAYGEAVEDMGI